MVDSGQSPIRLIDFASRLHPDIPVEVIERTELLRRFGPDYFATPERPSFHALLLVRSGRGVHTVDFQKVPVMAGRLIQMWPGQVLLWDTDGDFDASLVLSRPEMASARAWFPGHGAHRDLARDSMMTAETLIAALHREQTRFVSDDASARLMNALFAALSAVFDRADATFAGGQLPAAYVAFRAAIENDIGGSHNVRDYVQGLGYSERTVSRACQKVTGQSAKTVLNQRLVLETKRLLAHTDKPAATIATELGFTEPTNFHKFFARHTSERPSRFRARIRARI
jgi:AraC-like DNA-binding protein